MSAALSAAKKRRAPIAVDPPKFSPIQQQQQQPQPQPQQSGLTLQQVIALIDKRLPNLETVSFVLYNLLVSVCKLVICEAYESSLGPVYPIGPVIPVYYPLIEPPVGPDTPTRPPGVLLKLIYYFKI